MECRIRHFTAPSALIVGIAVSISALTILSEHGHRAAQKCREQVQSSYLHSGHTFLVHVSLYRLNWRTVRGVNLMHSCTFNSLERDSMMGAQTQHRLTSWRTLHLHLIQYVSINKQSATLAKDSSACEFIVRELNRSGVSVWVQMVSQCISDYDVPHRLWSYRIKYDETTMYPACMIMCNYKQHNFIIIQA